MNTANAYTVHRVTRVRACDMGQWKCERKPLEKGRECEGRYAATTPQNKKENTNKKETRRQKPEQEKEQEPNPTNQEQTKRQEQNKPRNKDKTKKRTRNKHKRTAATKQEQDKTKNKKHSILPALSTQLPYINVNQKWSLHMHCGPFSQFCM